MMIKESPVESQHRHKVHCWAFKKVVALPKKKLVKNAQGTGSFKKQEMEEGKGTRLARIFADVIADIGETVRKAVQEVPGERDEDPVEAEAGAGRLGEAGGPRQRQETQAGGRVQTAQIPVRIPGACKLHSVPFTEGSCSVQLIKSSIISAGIAVNLLS